MDPNLFIVAHSGDYRTMSAQSESDFVIINTRPLKRIKEDLEIRPDDHSNTPMQDLIAAFNAVEARIRLGKLGNAD